MAGRGRNAGLLAALGQVPTGPSQVSVLEGLRQVILDGRAIPGSTIPVGEVATHFGVSPIPVREALKTLVGEGLVGHQTNGSYVVAQLTVAELREIYFVRGVLEQAALSRSVETATEADLASAVDVHERLVTAHATGDSRAYHLNSRLFHRALIVPCGMYRLINMFESTWNITEPFQLMRASTPAMQAELLADHRTMIDAMARRDVTGLLTAATEHHSRLEEMVVDTAERLDLAHDPGVDDH